MADTKLTNVVTLGLHLGAGASDGYLTSAEYIIDETNSTDTKTQSIQTTIDNIVATTNALKSDQIKVATARADADITTDDSIDAAIGKLVTYASDEAGKASTAAATAKSAAEAAQAAAEAAQATADKKQDKLVSGTSIKTINGESLLGSGDITLDLTLYKLVTTLPTTDIDATKIYLVKDTNSGDTENVYIEYIYVDSKWEKLGEYKSDVDLTDYAKTADVDNKLSNYATKTYVDTQDGLKVDKVDGKGLSTNDFTDAYEIKLKGIDEGAEANVIETVKVNGTALTVTDKAVDVTVPTDISAFNNDSGYLTEVPTTYYTKTQTDSAISTALSGSNNYAFGTVGIIGADNTTRGSISAKQPNDKVILVAGNNVDLTTDTDAGEVTINVPVLSALNSLSTQPVSSYALVEQFQRVDAGIRSVSINRTEESATDTELTIRFYAGQESDNNEMCSAVLSSASTTVAGLLSATDKTKLDSLEALTNTEIQAAIDAATTAA